MSYFICSKCGFGSASWYGKCPNCNSWNTFIEKNENIDKNKLNKKENLKKISITSLQAIKTKNKERIKTGISELDRVLGGGFVPGEVILLIGEPGIGKSTLILQALKDTKTLYISGEESGEQVKERAERLNINLENFLFSNDVEIEAIIESASEIKEKIKILVIDSIQTVYSKNIEGNPSGINQIKESTKLLVNFAKKNNIVVIIVGHVTKEGEAAGPKTLEHLVDAVIQFEGEKISNYRLIRAIKNRFGPTDEIGVFEMKEKGLKEINNPLIFLENQEISQPGKAIVGVVEGKRTIFFEIQTLVSSSILPIPRRVVKGLDYNKILLLLAVIKKQLNYSFDNYDIYVNVISGVSIKSTSADLGFVASIISSLKNKPLPSYSLFVGEVGLLGEIRNVPFQEKIIQEGKRFGFKKIFSSKNIKNIKELSFII